MQLLDDLTEAQRQAVTHETGPLLVIAGPGSGKTRVITRRIGWLVNEGMPARNVLAITFTNKAASEMRSRIEDLLPNGYGRPFCSTFHSFCATFLRRYIDRLGFGLDFSIFDRSDSHACLREALDELQIDARQWRPQMFSVEISQAKDRFVTPEELLEESGGDLFATRAAQVYRYYQDMLKQRNALDFDDLLGHMVVLLRDHEDIRETLQNRFDTILVDEYQDTNHAQYLLAHHLTGPHQRICVSGDPDQSIYGWRGADIGNILRFEEDFPSARVVKLEQNYRSTAAILEAADALIRHNTQRKEKQLFTENETGHLPEICLFQDEEAEARGIVSRIADLLASNVVASEIAIFYRVNSLSRPLEQALWERRLPYVVVGALEFYQRKEVKDLIGYLRAISNPNDDLSLLRVLNTPSRGIGKVTVEKLRAHAREHRLGLRATIAAALEVTGLTRRARSALKCFEELIEALRDLREGPTADLLEEIIRTTGYQEYLARTYPDEDDRIDNVQALVTAARSYDERVESLPNGGRERFDPDPDSPSLILGGLAGFLEYTALLSEQDALKDGENCVSLMTLHTAKGLEFDQVLIAGVEEGTIPHFRSREDGSDLEEERRLLFVGMTRARKGLCMTLARWRTRFNETERRLPSSFLREIPPEIVKSFGGIQPTGWEDTESQEVCASAPAVIEASAEDEPWEKEQEPQPGERVYHDFFGAGVVKELWGDGAARRVRVFFDTHGEKRLVLQFARLSRSHRCDVCSQP